MVIKDVEISDAIRAVYPKHTKAAYSMAKRTPETGVMLCPGARQIRDELISQRRPRKPENRRNRFRIYGRLPDELAVRVQAKLIEKKMTMQDLLLSLLAAWIEEE